MSHNYSAFVRIEWNIIWFSMLLQICIHIYYKIYISREKYENNDWMLYISFSNLPEFVRKYHYLVADKNTVALRGPSRSLKRLGLGWAWRAHPLVSLDLCRRSNPRSRHHSLKQRESKFLYRVHFPRLLSYTFNKIFFFQISNSVMKHLMINWLILGFLSFFLNF